MTLFNFPEDLPLYEALRRLQDYLRDGGIEAADFEARQLLLSALGMEAPSI